MMQTISPHRPRESLAESLRHSPKKAKIWASLTIKERALLEYEWSFWARPSQRAPVGNWRTWLIDAGRGFGKTRSGAEWVREQAIADPMARGALVGRTAADVRDVMIQGESGILACSPPWFRPKYEPSKRRLVWPNGAMATAYSADKPDQLRGPQHTFAWADELASWRYTDAWDQLQFGLRLGKNPRQVVTTTPRPTPTIRALLRAATTAVTRGSTYDNKANLAPAFLDEIVRKYEGTRLGRQELYAELLEDVPGALWKRSMIDKVHVVAAPQMRRIVVAIDPAVSSTEASDETGIVCAGLGIDGRGYVLEDASGRYSPGEWASAAVKLYRDNQCDRIVAETNNGGALVEANLRTVDFNIPYRGVHASQGKRTRAEPIAALYEQGRISHVGALPQLEDQLCEWDPTMSTKSPDRLDALVWALTDLFYTPTQKQRSYDFRNLPPG